MHHITVSQSFHRQGHLGIDIGSGDIFGFEQYFVFQIPAGAIFHQQTGKVVVIHSRNTNRIHMRTERLIGSGANARNLGFLSIIAHSSPNNRRIVADVACPVRYDHFVEVGHTRFHCGIVIAQRGQRRTYRRISAIQGQRTVHRIGIQIGLLAHGPENADITVLSACRHILRCGRRGLVHNIL